MINEVLAGTRRWAVECGKSEEVLRSLPDACVDSIVCDPPYELGFMGRKWDASGIAYNVDLWREALRVLKPGGHLLAFGGTRTYHRMVCAIEDAGFEIRDSIQWLYGSGFPKSLNVSKAIDAADGLSAQREVVHSYTAGGNAGTPTAEKGGTYVTGAPNSPPVELHVTRGASERSQAWDGWGTALKPAHEPIVVARKPPEGTVAANVLEHGTGGINIDACRVSTDWNEPDRPESWKRSGHTAVPDAEKIAAPPGAGIECHPGGRWPANAIFSHSAGCKRVGAATESVPTFEASHSDRWLDRGAVRIKRDGGARSLAVPVYDCEPDCPVKLLGEQSGESGGNAPASGPTLTGASGSVARGQFNGTSATPFHGGTGTAARFFNTFEVEEPFFYCAKTPTAEREAGLDHLPVKSAGELTDREDGSDGLKSPRAGAGRTSSGRRNVHPTVKPIELMRWLCRLVTPPQGIVLDMFCGSGSTGCAAALERFRFIGIDMESAHVEIATGRIKHWEPKQLSIFDLLEAS